VWPCVLCFYITVVVTGLFTIWYVGWENVATWIFDTANAEDSKVVSALVLYCCFVFVTVFWLIPGPVFFLLLIGFFCGFWMGWVVAAFGEATSLVVSCLLVQSWSVVRDMVEENQTIKQAAEVLAEEDVKFIILFRFVTMPLPIKNYAVAIIQRPIWRKTLLCLPGIVFYTAIFAYFGSKAHAVMDKLRKGRISEIKNLFGGWEIVIIVVSVLASVGMACFAYIEYRRRASRLPSTTPLVSERSFPTMAYAAAPGTAAIYGSAPAATLTVPQKPLSTGPPAIAFTSAPSAANARPVMSVASPAVRYSAPPSMPVALRAPAQPVRYAAQAHLPGAAAVYAPPGSYAAPVTNTIPAAYLPPPTYAAPTTYASPTGYPAFPPHSSASLRANGV